jgi:hypothetical protein
LISGLYKELGLQKRGLKVKRTVFKAKGLHGLSGSNKCGLLKVGLEGLVTVKKVEKNLGFMGFKRCGIRNMVCG